MEETDPMSGKKTPLRWGIIGAGDVVRKRGAEAVRDGSSDAELTSIASRRRMQAMAVAEEFDIPRVLDVEDLMDFPDIDVIYVASPSSTHAEYVGRILDLGKHVLCEKPMAMSGTQAASLAGYARESGAILAVAYYRRAYPLVHEIKKQLQAGTLGPIISAKFLHGYRYEPQKGDSGSWRLNPEIGIGGPLADVGSHRIDLSLFFFGDPQSVSCHMTRGRLKPREVEDSALATMQYSDGTLVSVHVTHEPNLPFDTLEIVGQNGRIYVPDLEKGEAVLTTSSGETKLHGDPAKNRLSPLIEDFCLKVRKGGEPLCTGEEGAKTTKIVETAYRAAHEGHTISLDF